MMLLIIIISIITNNKPSKKQKNSNILIKKMIIREPIVIKNLDRIEKICFLLINKKVINFDILLQILLSDLFIPYRNSSVT